MTKIAGKACQHCAFTKNRLGSLDTHLDSQHFLAEHNSLLCCHEYSAKVVCANHYRLAPDRIPDGQKIQVIKKKGDLAHRFDNLTDEQKAGFKFVPKYPHLR